jgi:hypothetical protein
MKQIYFITSHLVFQFVLCANKQRNLASLTYVCLYVQMSK